MKNLRDSCSSKPSILHFSGHGELSQAGEDFLIIEDDNLKGQNLSESKIAELFVREFEERVEGIRLAVVLSCHSETVGSIFKKAGIKHVICIKRQHVINDRA